MTGKHHLDFFDLQKSLGGENMDLCHYCGSCIAVCPHDALRPDDTEKPVVDPEKCTPCSLCSDVCSGIKVDMDGLRTMMPDTRDDDILGPYKKTYLAHAIDQDTRDAGSSGGMTSAILRYALDKGLIDGAIVAGSKEDEPWKPETKLVRNSDEFLKYAQSKYVYMPTNAFLRELWDKLDGRDGNYALVGLPCQIHSVREMQRLGIKYTRNIKYQFGLICGYNMSIDATEFVRRKLKIEEEEIAQLRYRDQEWPGGMTFYLKNGEKRGIDLFHYHYLNAVFLPTRCRTGCADFFAEFSDISFGDSWLPELYPVGENIQGWSSVISRTEAGEELLQNAVEDGAVHLQEVGKNKIEDSFPFNIKYKKRGIYVRMKMARHVPEMIGRFAPPQDMSIGETAYHVIYNLLLIFGASRFCKAMIYLTPLPVLRAIIQVIKRIMGYPPNARDTILKYKNKTVF